MDKTTFVAQAPYYYALAILDFLGSGSDDVTIAGVMRHYAGYDREAQENWEYMHSEALSERALQFLIENGLVSRIEDLFGPPLISLAKNWTEVEKTLDAVDAPVFRNIKKAKDRDEWLKTSLKCIYKAYHDLAIREDDIESPERQWDPLPLDRGEPLLAKTIERLDETIEAVRGENGYDEVAQTERALVLDSLRVASRSLKEEKTTSAAYLRRYALEPLTMLVKRFGRAAVGVAAEAARAAMRDWLKQCPAPTG